MLGSSPAGWDIVESPAMESENDMMKAGGSSGIFGGGTGAAGQLAPSPLCNRCKTLMSSSSGRTLLGRYCLCSVNQDIEREVLQTSARAEFVPQSSHFNHHANIVPYEGRRQHDTPIVIHVGPSAVDSTSFPGGDGGARVAYSAGVAPPGESGGGQPPSPVLSARSSAGTTIGDQTGAREGARGVSRSGTPENRGSVTLRTSTCPQGATSRIPSPRGKLSEESPLTRNASSVTIVGDSAVVVAAGPARISGGGGGSTGLKRARERRADRRRKKDPFEAFGERLLDGYSLESIARKLERQDEILLKGVRHVERIKSRHRGDPGRGKSEVDENKQRYSARQRVEMILGQLPLLRENKQGLDSS